MSVSISELTPGTKVRYLDGVNGEKAGTVLKLVRIPSYYAGGADLLYVQMSSDRELLIPVSAIIIVL